MVIFDLDGTLSDPAEGITGSLNHALEQLGHPTRPSSELLRYIGPPLGVAFSELMDTADRALIERAIELYREHYKAVGYSQNRLYDGIPETLARLADSGLELRIATYKRSDIAVMVAEHLGIAPLFHQIHGCDAGISKGQLLRRILPTAESTDVRSVMVGDRDSDFIAAAEAGIQSLGVAWGYGTAEELDSATDTVGTLQHLPSAIRRILS
ncbi:MAG: HAD hydrolase-like protein [Gammaproteobacteria bacterium]